MPQRSRRASTLEIALVTAVFAGWFILASIGAVLAGFPAPSLSDNDAINVVVFEAISFTVAATILWARGWKPRDFQLRISWWFSIVGVALWVVAYAADWIFSALVGNLVGGQNFVEQFAKSISLSLPVALLASIVNGAYEEFFMTRYLVDALSTHGAPVALGTSALVRLGCHLYQGPVGALSVIFIGVIFTLFYWRYREVWPVMIAHMLTDLIAFV